MIKNKFYYLTAILAMALTSCIIIDVYTETDPIAVNLHSNFAKIGEQSRMAGDQFETADQVGLFMVQANQSLSGTTVFENADNVLMTVSNNGWLAPADAPLLYPTAGNVAFIAYFPFTDAVSNSFTIPVTAGNQSAGLAGEVLYSNNITNQVPTPQPVTLDFRYSLAKLRITLANGSHSPLTVAEFADMTLSISEVYTEAELQLTDGTLTNRAEKQTVSLYQASHNGNSATFEALVLPFADAQSVDFEFTIGNTTHTHTVPMAHYEAGNLYRLHFVLNFSVVTLVNTNIIPRDPVDKEEEIEIDPIPPTSIELNRTEMLLAINGEETLTATVLPRYAAPGVKWTSDNPAVATVDANGKVSAVSIGTATITAVTVVGGVEATCEVEVDGVEINEIVWATRNVDAPGTFAANPQDAGMFYQWNRRTGWAATGTVTGWDSSIPEGDTWEAANDPCPAGWRVPNSEELSSLNSAIVNTGGWATLNGVNGRLFGSVPNQIFLPAAGSRITFGALFGAGVWGFYWSSSANSARNGWHLHITSGNSNVTWDGRANGFSVRCVSE